MKGYSYLVWAYNLVWIGISAYIGFVVLRLRKVNQRLERLEKRVGANGSGAGQ